MATDTGGPATGQALKLYLGAPKTVGVTIPDPAGIYSGPGVTAEWWAGPLPPPLPFGAQNCVVGSEGSIHKTGLPVTVPTPGTVQVTFVAEPEDLQGLLPLCAPAYQHEVWLAAPGRKSQMVTVGALKMIGTLRAAAA